MSKFKVREGSIVDYGRIVITGALFWGILLWTAFQAYGM